MTHLGWSDSLSVAESGRVRAVLAAAHAADGVGPVSDDVALAVRPGAAPAAGRGHLLAAGPADDISGYAHLAHASDGAWEAELVVRPEMRRRGVATALVDALVGRVADGLPAAATASHPSTLDVWAHGDSAAAAALAARTGFERGRVLLQLRRPLTASGDDELPDPVWPTGVTVRTFVPGRDERSWLALNARSFATHPEQGRWTEQDLLPREAEPWFDPAGFFLAERDGELAGFHWTKVHAEDPMPPEGKNPADRTDPAPAIGEVYVVGVDPARAGGGLGRALTLAGLRHLRDRGLASVMLYVDEDNARAVRLYERLGFTRYAVDAQYRRRIPAG